MDKLILKIDQVEEILNKGIEFTKRFLQDEEGNRLTNWSIGGYLKGFTQYVQDELNKVEIITIPEEDLNQYVEKKQQNSELSNVIKRENK